MIESLTGQGINVQQACIALGVSQSGYYAWKDRPDAPRTCGGSGWRVRSPRSTRRRRSSCATVAAGRPGSSAGAIHDYIELWHNTRRRHSALGMRTPSEIEDEWHAESGARLQFPPPAYGELREPQPAARLAFNP